jgi:hypothetical protein
MTAGVSALLVVIGGGAGVVAVMTGDETQVTDAAGRGSTADAPIGGLGGAGRQAPARPGGLGLSGPMGNPGGPVGAPAGALGDRLGDAGAAERDSATADLAGVRPLRRGATGSAAGAGPAAPLVAGATTAPPAGDPAPVITTRTVSEKQSIPFSTEMVRDPDLRRGQRRVDAEGVEGERTLRWLVTYSDGRQTARRLVDSAVTREPQPQVIAIGWRNRGWDRDPGHWPGHGHHGECESCSPFGRGACAEDAPAEDDSGGDRSRANGGDSGAESGDVGPLPDLGLGLFGVLDLTCASA